jgi:hypothetical protein
MNPPLCETCEINFESAQNLIDHISNNHMNRPYVIFVCKLCQSEDIFLGDAYRTLIQLHISKHTTHTTSIPKESESISFRSSSRIVTYPAYY